MRRITKQRSSKVLKVLVLLPFFAQTFLTPILALDELILEDSTSVIEVDIPIDTSEDILEEGIATGPEDVVDIPVIEEIVSDIPAIEEVVVDIPELPVMEEEVEPIWLENGYIATTNDVVVLGEVYIAPQNGAVSLSFSKLPEGSGYLTVNEITLTDEEVEATGAISNIAYDITTDMVDGTYEYDLTLPTTSDDVSVVYAESRGELLENTKVVNEEVKIENGRVEIEGLEHFTVFVVVETIPVGIAEGVTEVNNDCTVELVGSDTYCYGTIQGAIDAAVANGSSEQDVINIQNGTYNEHLTIGGDNITLLGESRTGVIIDTSAFTTYGISVSNVDNVTFRKMTVIGAQNFTFKISHSSDITLRQITVKDSKKTGIDLNTIDGANLNSVTINDTTNGFGLMILDSNDITVNTINTSGNAWGGVSVQTASRPSDNITFTGNFNVDEFNALLLEKDGPTLYDITNITLPSSLNYVTFGYETVKDYYKSYYYESLDDAKSFASILSSLSSYEDIIIHDLLKDNYWVIPGLSIQDAIDDSTNGDRINILSGIYEEQLKIEGKDIMLEGEDPSSTIINSPITLTTQFSTNKPVVYIHNAQAIIQNLTVDGLGRANGNYRMQGIAFYNASGEVNNANIINIKETPANGSQHGVGLYVYNDDGTDRIVDVDTVNINNYQKNGVVFAGEKLTANIFNSTIQGLGQIAFIAQNGIQYSYGATGIAEKNIIFDNYYMPATWSATGILVDDAGDKLEIGDNEIYNNGWGGLYVYGAGSNLEIYDNHIHDNLGDGIILSGSSIENATIYSNIIENNDNGIWVDSDVPNNLRVYNNTFDNLVNAEDDGNHYLDNGTIGNFWSDYTGLDLDGDGIGETEYTIDADSSDRYPLTSNYLSVDVISVETSKEYYKNGDILSITVEVTNNGSMELDPTKETLVVNLRNPQGSFISGSFREVYPLSLASGETNTITFYTTPQTIPSSWSEGTYKVYTSVYSNRVSLGYLMGGQSSDATFILDNTASEAPTGLHILDHEDNNLACGGYTNNRNITIDWNDNPENDIDYYILDLKDKDNHKQLVLSEYNATIRNIDELYKYKIRAVDYAGNISESSNWCAVTLDRVAPVVGITQPMDTEYVKGTVDIKGWVSDANLSHYNIAIYPSGVDVNDFSLRIEQNTENTSEFTEKTLYTWDTTNGSFPDGEYQIRLAARDLAGNRELGGDSEDVITVTIDNTPPSIDFELPTDGSYHIGNIDLRATCDEDCDYINFWWRAEGETFSSASKRYHYVHDNGTTFEWTLDSLNAEKADSSTYTMPDGTYYLYAAGKDLVGNWARTPEVMIVIDNNGPVIAGHADMTLVEGEAFPTDTVTLTDNIGLGKVFVRATDLTNGLGFAQDDSDVIEPLALDQFPLADEIRQAIESWQSSPFTIIDLNVLPEGQYEIDYYATDKAGNESNHESFTVTIEDNVPTVTVTPTTSTVLVGAPAVVLSTAVTNGNAPFTYLWSGDCTGTGSTTSVPTNIADTYTCTVQVTDTDGDTSTTSATVAVNAVPAVLGLGDEEGDGDNDGDGIGGYFFAQVNEEEGEEEEEETPEDTDTDTDEEVLGESTCESTYKISGIVFIDKNKDGIYDEGEKGIASIDVKIFDSNGDLVKTVQTDEDGKWEVFLCPGEYTTEVEGAENQEFILGESDTTLNIPVEKKFPWWWIAIIGTSILILLGFLVDRSKKKEELF